MELFRLQLRGSSKTLGKLVSGKDYTNFKKIICFLQTSRNLKDELPISFKFELKSEKNIGSYYSLFLTEEDFRELTEWAVEEGYCTLDGDVLTFTDKAMDVFQKTIDKDNKLKDSGFSYCPCQNR